jgi:SAM-dependent methyltransferase
MGEAAPARDDSDGIAWEWRAQIDASEFYSSLVRAVSRHTPPKSRVLEIGVGAGYVVARQAVDQGCWCVGIDRLEAATRAATQTAKVWGARLILVQGSGFRLPFADGAFDLVMSHGVVEHYQDARARAMIGEHARVCRPGGTVIVSTPNSLDLPHVLRRLWLGRRYSYYPERSYFPWSLARDMRVAGLKVVARDGCAPLWGLRQCRLAYPVLYVLHKTGLLARATALDAPGLLSFVGSLTMCIACKPNLRDAVSAGP